MTDNCDLIKLLFCTAFDNADEETKEKIEKLLTALNQS